MNDKQITLTHDEVIKLTGVGRNTIYNWSKTLRDTDLVLKDGEKQFDSLGFTPEFAVLMLARKGKSTPGATDPQVIATAVPLYLRGKSVERIAEALEVSVEAIEWIGLSDVDARDGIEIYKFIEAKQAAQFVEETE